MSATTTIVAFAVRRAARRAAVNVAQEHLGTREQRRKVEEDVETLIGQSPINRGPAENAILSFMGLDE